MNRFTCLLLILSLISPSASFAQIPSPSLGSSSSFGSGQGTDYYVGLNKGKPLITVNLMSGVRLPGVYHVPIGTDLAELVSYAGGTTPEADLTRVTIRSKTKAQGFNIRTFSFSKIVSENSALPALNDQDVVQFEQAQGLDKTIKWLSIASMAASILSVIIIVSDRNRN